MSLNFKQKLIASKIEATYGTDSTPVGANAIVTKNLKVTPMEADKLERNLDGSSLGNKGSAVTNKRTKHGYDVELAGAGAAGTAPSYGLLLRACGFAETINAGVDVSYSPVSGGFESISEYLEQDGILHNLLGGRGNVGFTLNAGEYPIMNFDMTGFYVTPTAGTIANPVYTGFQEPTEINNTNTTSATFMGFGVIMKSLNLDMGNVVNYRNLVGQEAVLIGDRAPSGTIVIEAPTLAQKDFFADAAGNQTGALSVTHGTVAGNIIVLDAPKIEIDAPTYSDDNGILMMSIGFRPLPVNGDDEVKLTIK